MSNVIAFPVASFSGAADLTMSSLEIAELTGKRHDNVMVDAHKMLTELYGAGGLLKFQDTYRHAQNGQTYNCFRLPKRECLVLVSGYSVTLRAAIVDRWAELEAKAAGPALPNFADPIAAAEAFIVAERGRREATAQAEAERTLRITAQAETEALKPVAAVGALAVSHTHALSQLGRFLPGL
ncbi:MAG: Rha family transcriptional regulator [Methylorubrum rhodinum]|uniref:Rha family transcriptional regulator n=1 Tax=Methylorubrum rhodinum TaxID=29428 RepID=UPI003BB12C26